MLCSIKTLKLTGDNDSSFILMADMKQEIVMLSSLFGGEETLKSQNCILALTHGNYLSVKQSDWHIWSFETIIK